VASATLAAMTPSGPPELDVARIRRWCDERVPVRVRDQIRIECEVATRYLTWLKLVRTVIVDAGEGFAEVVG
jgi:hypothetical protein